MANNDGFTSGQMMLAFLGGAAAGAAVAYLTAPRSGAETRQLITDSIAAKREEIARLPPAIRAAYDAGASAAREAYKGSIDTDEAGGKDE